MGGIKDIEERESMDDMTNIYYDKNWENWGLEANREQYQKCVIGEKNSLFKLLWFFIGTQIWYYLIFRFPGKCSKVLDLLWTLGMSIKANVFFSEI